MSDIWCGVRGVDEVWSVVRAQQNVTNQLEFSTGVSNNVMARQHELQPDIDTGTCQVSKISTTHATHLDEKNSTLLLDVEK
jgi:hypothetical protein